MATNEFVQAAHDAKLDCKNGLNAIEKKYKGQITTEGVFTGSVDLDSHFKSKEPQNPRWDYGVGLELNSTEYAVWIEPHSASSPSEAGTMLKKLDWLKNKLQEPEFEALKKLTRNKTSYYWLYPDDGKNRILKDSKESRSLARAGLSMPTRQLRLS